MYSQALKQKFLCFAYCAVVLVWSGSPAMAGDSTAPVADTPVSVETKDKSDTTSSAAESSPKADDANSAQVENPSGASLPNGSILKGKVSAGAGKGMLLNGFVQTIPKGTPIDLVLMGNINSEVSQKGDEVYVRVGSDVKAGQGVLVPGDWYMHGLVTGVASQRRLGRNGYISIQFDKLVSPDGDVELPFGAQFSTKDNLLKSSAKEAFIDSGYMAQGAVGGAIMSVQLGGVPLAIASHGYSVAIGAGVGATIGAVAALKRKGKIASLYPGDEIKLTTAEPIALPGFDSHLLPSAKPVAHISNLEMQINKVDFVKDPLGDKRSRLLVLDLTMRNETKHAYSFFDLAVVSDHHQRYYPSLATGFHVLRAQVKPHSSATVKISFSIDNPKHKYWLVLLDQGTREELTRVPVN
jgi:biotin carboxyl carrier protein